MKKIFRLVILAVMQLTICIGCSNNFFNNSYQHELHTLSPNINDYYIENDYCRPIDINELTNKEFDELIYSIDLLAGVSSKMFVLEDLSKWCSDISFRHFVLEKVLPAVCPLLYLQKSDNFS